MEALADEMMSVIVKTAKDHAMPGTLKSVEIIASKLGDNAGIARRPLTSKHLASVEPRNPNANPQAYIQRRLRENSAPFFGEPSTCFASPTGNAFRISNHRGAFKNETSNEGIR